MASSSLHGVEISATQFLQIFQHYDKDGNGFLEGAELQSFLTELQQARRQAGQELTDQMKTFLRECEKNADRKIGLVELVQILPNEENFLLVFRQQLKSWTQFMEAWRRYDADHSGYIEADELKNFLKDLLLKAQMTYDNKKLDEYTAATLKMFDSDGDGKLCLAEMARLLPDDQNFLLRFQGVKMPRKEFNKVFELYDQDDSGYMDETELDALLKDLCGKNKKALKEAELPHYRSSIMALSDGGRLYRAELALVLCADD